ncbi:MAG: PLDc_N domain-containing protein [Hyphomonadaceae bacterium]|nr:PLDc_N domain-containing protein [Hyphomonadaceae bacterium]
MFGQDWPPFVTIGFLIALVLALWSVFNVAQSSATPMSKAIWIVVVLFLPYLGFLAWLFFGPRTAR